jgi:hypothetical protein
MPRHPINPPPTLSFDDACRAITRWPGQRTPELRTTGGVSFVAEAAVTTDGRRFISLPHNNRIYEADWGYRTNSMGKDGQRIGQYSVPLDEWASRL